MKRRFDTHPIFVDNGTTFHTRVCTPCSNKANWYACDVVQQLKELRKVTK